jgi:hypothetical protein
VISIVDDIDPSLVINSITAAPGAVCSQEGNLVSCSTSSSVPPMIGDGDVPDTLIATINVTAPAAGMGAVRHQVTATWIAEAPATTSSSTSYPWWTALVSPPN